MLKSSSIGGEEKQIAIDTRWKNERPDYFFEQASDTNGRKEKGKKEKAEQLE